MDREFLNAIQGRPDYSVRRGEIYYVSKTKQGGITGSEIMPGRPAIVVSNDSNNQFSPTVEVVYLTTKEKADIPTHVVIDATKYRSIAMCEQITSVSKERLGTFVNRVSDEEMKNIDEALLISLGLDELKENVIVDDERVEDKVVNEDNQPDPQNAYPVDLMKIIVERDTYKKLYEELLDKIVK